MVFPVAFETTPFCLSAPGLVGPSERVPSWPTGFGTALSRCRRVPLRSTEKKQTRDSSYLRSNKKMRILLARVFWGSAPLKWWSARSPEVPKDELYFGGCCFCFSNYFAPTLPAGRITLKLKAESNLGSVPWNGATLPLGSAVHCAMGLMPTKLLSALEFQSSKWASVFRGPPMDFCFPFGFPLNQPRKGYA